VGARESLNEVLPLTCHQCSIHCSSSRVANGDEKQAETGACRTLMTLQREYKASGISLLQTTLFPYVVKNGNN